MLGGEARARPYLPLESVGQCDDKPGRDHRVLARREQQRRLFGNRGQEVETGCLAALIGRQRQTLGVG